MTRQAPGGGLTQENLRPDLTSTLHHELLLQ